MTDNAPTQNKTIWIEIARFLDNADLAKYRQLCTFTQLVGSHVVILQPLYNRLYAIDNTLPAALSQEGTLLAFQQAFKKIQARQQSEIAYLTRHHPALIAKPDYVKTFLESTSLTLTSLEIREGVLDKMNREIIEEKINLNSHYLDLDMAYITRLPISLFQVEIYLDFWQNLTHLSCKCNQLTTLNVQALTALQFLNCCYNHLTELNVQGLAMLERLDCYRNQLTELNVQGLAELKDLDCSNNPLKTLILEGVHVTTKKKYADLEKNLRFKQLSPSSDEAIAEGISPGFLPSFASNNPSSENAELKRKRDEVEELNDEPETKRTKKG